MSRFEIGLNLIFAGIYLIIISGNPLVYMIGMGITQVVISIIEMVNDHE